MGSLLVSGVAVGLVVGLFILLMILLSQAVIVVQQSNRYVIERLGVYSKSLDAGVHFVIPFFDRIRKKVSLKEQVVDFAPQPVITKDNVTMQIDTVVFYMVTDAKLFTYGVNSPLRAIENLTATTLRNIIGDLELDESLTSRDQINSKMRIILDEATDPWGIKIIRVEVKNIIPPKDIREAMEKQMRAERERRQAILLAEGEKKSNILTAEGEKQSKILRAEADKEARIREAEGRAQAILEVQNATARGIEMIKKAGADEAFLRLEAYKAMVEVSQGQATKLIIPSDLQGMVGIAGTLAETFKTDKK
ncbi:SPFH/Band 7/PHB domain protein [Candidatus Xianfuyuplasma coldseepsis]|uniref:SPFH/Band 7/PHB domain protein n=2 Tax=Candidatus Xianfuyuplasma coldseepsis TaxID=2782163 RepID=A0A7L7KWA7_9MOLU|nr:SPFH/Band 7/PHB domain protein [Xianfuyuplasma coldseepsis]